MQSEEPLIVSKMFTKYQVFDQGRFAIGLLL